MAERRRTGLLIGLLVALVVVFAVAWILARKRTGLVEIEVKAKSGLTVSSVDFSNGGTIPAKFTCDGEDVSPQLTISGAPANTKSLAVIADDPDARLFLHWLVFNLPAGLHDLPEGASSQGAVAGKNDFGKDGYGGPCPPPGKAHHYIFHVYALDTKLNLSEGASKEEINRAIAGHLLAAGVLTGVYQGGQ
jgi:Raf kinase inhibitor-like YbhB/YbcL family protein